MPRLARYSRVLRQSTSLPKLCCLGCTEWVPAVTGVTFCQNGWHIHPDRVVILLVRFTLSNREISEVIITDKTDI